MLLLLAIAARQPNNAKYYCAPKIINTLLNKKDSPIVIILQSYDCSVNFNVALTSVKSQAKIKVDDISDLYFFIFLYQISFFKHSTRFSNSFVQQN